MNLFYFRITNCELVPDNKRDFGLYLEKNNNKKVHGTFKRETGIRTTDQNSALHLYCTHVSDALNDAGETVQHVLQQKMDVEWNMKKVKELLWRDAQKTITGKESTKDLDKVEDINKIYDHLNRHLSEKFFIHVPFPHDPKKDKAPLK